MTVYPKCHFAIAFADVVHLEHRFHTNPFLFGNGQFRVLDERVPPGLTARRTPSHGVPVRVIVPSPRLPKGFDPHPKRFVTAGRFPCSDAGPSRGGAVTS